MKLNRALAAAVLSLVAAISPSSNALAGALSPFGSLATVSGPGIVDTDFHVGSLQPSFANITFNAGSASDSGAQASAAVNALSANASVFSFDNGAKARAWAEYEDTLAISAPAGTAVVPVAVGISFSAKLQILAGGDVGGYAYAVKTSQVFVTGLGTGFFTGLLARDCLSSIENGAEFFHPDLIDPCLGFDPSTNKTAAVLLIPIGSINIDVQLIADVGAAPGCDVDPETGQCSGAFGSFASASDPFQISLTALTPGVSIMSESGVSYAALPSTVPEPGTVMLLAASLAGLGFSRRKRS